MNVLTNTLELGMRLDDLGLVEERDEWLVRCLDQHELKGVAIESYALK